MKKIDCDGLISLVEERGNLGYASRLLYICENRPVWWSLFRCDKARKEHVITLATKCDGENAVGSHCVGNTSSCKPQHGCEPSLSAPIPYVLTIGYRTLSQFQMPGAVYHPARYDFRRIS